MQTHTQMYFQFHRRCYLTKKKEDTNILKLAADTQPRQENTNVFKLEDVTQPRQKHVLRLEVVTEPRQG